MNQFQKHRKRFIQSKILQNNRERKQGVSQIFYNLKKLKKTLHFIQEITSLLNRINSLL